MELPGDPHSLCLRADTGSRLSPILNCFFAFSPSGEGLGIGHPSLRLQQPHCLLRLVIGARTRNQIGQHGAIQYPQKFFQRPSQQTR